MLSGPGLKKNKKKSHLGSEGLGTVGSSVWLPAISPFCVSETLPLDWPVTPFCTESLPAISWSFWPAMKAGVVGSMETVLTCT